MTDYQSRFIESFDAVRFGTEAGLDPTVARAHAEIELLVGLLFGQGVHVSEPMAMDSRGLISTAFEVVRAYRALPPAVTPAPEPFLLGTVGSRKPLKQVIVERLRRPGFILSGWPNLSNDTVSREKIATLLGNDDFRGAIDHCRERSFTEEVQNLERLRVLCEHFDEQRSFMAGGVPAPLGEYSRALTQALASLVDGEKIVRAAKIKHAIRRLSEREVSLDNRSQVRLYRTEIVDTFGSETYDDLIDFADTAYNMVIADSLGTDQNMFSVRKAGDPEQIFLGEEIAHAVRRSLVPGTGSSGARNDVQIEIALDSRLYLQAGEVIPPVDWLRVMRVLNSATWLDSMMSLKNAVAQGRYDHAPLFLDRHLEIVNAEIAPYSITRKEGILQVLVRKVQVDRKEAGIGFAKVAVEAAVTALFIFPWIGKIAAAAAGAVLKPGLPEPRRDVRLITGKIEQSNSPALDGRNDRT